MTRRTAAVLALLALTGCAGLKEAFTGHQDVVARVGSHELTAEMLANTIADSKQVPLRRDVMQRLASIWVEYQLVGQAVASGDSLLDSATIAAANWPIIAQQLANSLHDSLIVRRATLSANGVDSAFNAGNERYVYHLLVAVKQDTTDAVKNAKLRQAQGYLAQIRHGANFEQLASAHSDDPGSKQFGGKLGLVQRGVMVKPFEDAVFTLGPGQTSDIVTTSFGYHIIWRPSLDQVRDSFAAAVKLIAVDRLDSLYLDSLTHRAGIKVRSSAPARVRAAAEDVDAAKENSRVLATYPGGRLRESDFAKWLQAYPAQIRDQIGRAPDSVLSEFVGSVARNDMLLRSAQQMGIHLSTADWDSIRSNYRRELAAIEGTLAVSLDSLNADSTSKSQPRSEVAARHVDEYFQAITSPSQRRQYIEVPPFLADALRDKVRWQISQAGVDRALERARVIRGPETPPANTINPAPGGPPLNRGSRLPPPRDNPGTNVAPRPRG